MLFLDSKNTVEELSRSKEADSSRLVVRRNSKKVPTSFHLDNSTRLIVGLYIFT